jgi:hypothetical protein
MATNKHTTREKTTNTFYFNLLANGSYIDLSTVHHVEMHMMDKQKTTYRYSSLDSSPAVAIFDATEGKVSFTPPSETTFLYVRSPYRIYWQVWETSSKKYSVPEDVYFEIEILQEY